LFKTGASTLVALNGSSFHVVVVVFPELVVVEEGK
jgi:hypothetical protein